MGLISSTSSGKRPANVDHILKGEKPADLPVQASTKYYTVLNLKTARRSGSNCRPCSLPAPTR
jgi:putative tryptophan/tyrosine transport system substrate-binding protein